MKRSTILVVSFTFLIGCSATIISHDERLAAEKAKEFAEVLFVQNNVSSAYAMLSESARRGISLEKFKQVSVQMHPTARPAVVSTTEFEPIPGQQAMNIYVMGESGNEKYYYRVTMEGTAEKGYAPSAFYRGTGPYPASNLRKRLG